MEGLVDTHSSPALKPTTKGSSPDERCNLGEICVVAVADTFRGDGALLPGMGTIPMLGARLARATFGARLPSSAMVKPRRK